MEKKENNKNIPTNILRGMAVLVVALLGYNGLRVVKVSASLDQQLKEMRKEAAVETQRLDDLKIEYENIDSLHTVESMAREKLGYVKEDEIVFREKY